MSHLSCVCAYKVVHSKTYRVQLDRTWPPHLGCVPADKVVHGLLGGEAADGGQHAERVARKQDHL